MVNILLFCLIPFLTIQPDTNILFVSKYCSPCKRAVKLVPDDTKIIDMHDSPILANKYKIIAVPTYLIRKNNQVILKLVGLTEIRDYCNRYNQEASFTGVYYFTNNKVVHNQITSGILRRIKRLGANLKILSPDSPEAKEYNVQFLPTFIFMENGKEVGRYQGIIPSNLKPCP